jgi:hypothetical protein
MAFKKVNHMNAFTGLQVKLPPQNMLKTQKHSFLFQHLLYWNRGFKFKGCQPDFSICILINSTAGLPPSPTNTTNTSAACSRKISKSDLNPP